MLCVAFFAANWLAEKLSESTEMVSREMEKEVCESTGAKILFQSQDDTDQELITIIGTKEGIATAKTEVLALIKDLDNIVEDEVNVDPKHHKHFVVREIGEEYGGVTDSFPGSEEESDRVVIKVAKDCVEGVKKRIREIVADLDAQVTVKFVIRQQFYRRVMGGCGVRKIQEDFKVDLCFPRANDNPDIIMITGEEDDVFECKDYLLDIEEEFVRESTGAKILFQSQDDTDQELITIIGTKEGIATAKTEVLALIKDLDNIVEDEVNVDPKHHKHFVVREIGEEYGGVTDSFPGSEEESDRVVIKVAKDCVEGVKKRIREIVADLDAQVTVKFVIRQQFYRRVMGGCGVRKIQEDFKVDLCFPRANDNPDIIMITGEEDDVFECKDYLLDIEEEFLQDHMYNENIRSLTKAPSRNQDSQTTRGKAFMIFNAPWDAAAETSSTAKFPGFPGYWKYRGPKYKPSLGSKKILTC